jgi:hypothetical protein
MFEPVWTETTTEIFHVGRNANWRQKCLPIMPLIDFPLPLPMYRAQLRRGSLRRVALSFARLFITEHD